MNHREDTMSIELEDFRHINLKEVRVQDMLESISKNGRLDYQKMTPEEMKSKGILGRLVGPVADFMNPTRNGRKYTEELWEQTFNSPIMKEKLANGVCYGELGHPEDRTEIDMSKIAVCLREQPKKNSKGQLEAVFDILDTPNGRILKTLCDYGSKLGVSSRGTGDIVTDDEGNEMVDPNTYECECWDIVLIPAVESARLEYVKESLDNVKSLKQALNEELEKASQDDKRVMEETLHSLNIGYSSSKKSNNIDESKSNEKTTSTSNEAIDNGLNEVMKSLKESLKTNKDLEAQRLKLQNDLAVSNTKVEKLEEELGRYKSTTIRLSTLANESKEYKKKLDSLNEELTSTKSQLKLEQSKVKKLTEGRENLKTMRANASRLNESIENKDNEIKSLTESFKTKEKELNNTISNLNEKLQSIEDESKQKLEESKTRISKAKRVVESYKSLLNDTVDRYITSKATMLGISSNEIRNRLSESYTLDEIDSVCESLANNQVSISKLPFNLSNKNTKIKVTKSRNESLDINSNPDDDIDESLRYIVKNL